jgi:hypothetical protein
MFIGLCQNLAVSIGCVQRGSLSVGNHRRAVTSACLRGAGSGGALGRGLSEQMFAPSGRRLDRRNSALLHCSASRALRKPAGGEAMGAVAGHSGSGGRLAGRRQSSAGRVWGLVCMAVGGVAVFARKVQSASLIVTLSLAVGGLALCQNQSATGAVVSSWHADGEAGGRQRGWGVGGVGCVSGAASLGRGVTG